MNKKVLTLCAGFSLTATAQGEWIPVSADQLVNGAEYRIMKGDSVLADAQNLVGPVLTSSVNAPIFKGLNENPNYVGWTLTKVENGFTLKSDSTNANPIYTYNGGLFTNGASSPSTVFNLVDSMLVVGTDTVHSWGGLYLPTTNIPAQIAKVVFQMKQPTMSQDSIADGSAVLEEVSGLVYIVQNNKYIGAVPVETQTRAASTAYEVSELSAEAFEALTEEQKQAYSWTKVGEALKNVAYNVYLNVNSGSELVLDDDVVTIDIDETGSILTTDEGSAAVTLLSAQFGAPVQPVNGVEANTKEDATSIVLTVGGKVVATNEDEEIVFLDSYDENEALYTVWTLTPVEKTKGKYVLTLVNNGVTLSTENGYVYVDVDVTKEEDGSFSYTLPSELVLKTSTNTGDQYVGFDATAEALTETTSINESSQFGAGQIQIAKMYVKDLLPRGAEFFNVTITYLKDTDDETDLTSIFAGNLTPYSYINYDGGDINKTLSGPNDTEFMLMNEKGQILAVNIDPDARLSEGSANHVYPLTLIEPNDLMNDMAKPVADQCYRVWFSIEYTPGKDATTTGAFGVTDIKANIGNGTNADWKTIGCYLDKTVPTLVAADEVTLKDVTIELNASKVVNAQNWLNKPAYYTVEVANVNEDAAHYGKVLGLDASGLIDYVDPAKTNIELPEGQFAITYVYQDAEGEDLEYPYYKFTNRETSNSITDYDRSGNPIEFTLLASSLYSVDGGTTFAYRHGGHMDTLAIKAVTDYKSEDGFKRFTAEELNANTYNISMPILNGPLYVIENHNDRHRVGLDAEEATDWRIEMSTVRMMDAANDLVRVVPDTVSVPTTIRYWADNAWRETQITNPKGKYYAPNTELQIPTYILKNTATNEYLDGKDYEEEVGNAYYVCNEDERTATRVALKLVGDSTINLIPVMGQSNYDEVAEEYKNDWFAGIEIKESAYDTYANALTLQGQKIIGGTTVATGVLHDVTRFQSTDNDLFVITPSDARTYALLEQGENIILMREKNNDEVVYEDGEFAGIDNRLAYEDINPTLYVDTAYVDRAGNYKYQYLLMVQPSLSNEWYCPYNEEHNTEAWKEENGVDHCADAVRTDRIDGRFLVNMRDSADANEDVHNNKFEYDGESKLAFVPGYHQNDTLYLTNEAGEVIAKSEVGNSAAHYAKFAFKMINEDQNEFVVEVGEGFTEQTTVTYKGGNRVSETSKGEPTVGYLRWHNGNLVVTPNLDQAEHFTMEASELQATANEEISAENAAVSVVATDGAVVIKGAAGKNVVIATILGKVVANETINSDNETIAVPAGIAVVSVDGESFKVVVK